MADGLTRRDFFRTGTIVAAGLAVPAAITDAGQVSRGSEQDKESRKKGKPKPPTVESTDAGSSEELERFAEDPRSEPIATGEWWAKRTCVCCQACPCGTRPERGQSSTQRI